MKNAREEFLSRIKYTVEDSKNQRDKNTTNKNESEDTGKEEREKQRGGYERSLGRKKVYETKIKNRISKEYKKVPKEGKKLDEIVENLIKKESGFLNICIIMELKMKVKKVAIILMDIMMVMKIPFI